MKIGIVTFHAAHNYGAMLQAYALCTTLQESGHDARIVNYWPRKKAKALYPLAISKSWPSLKYGLRALFPGEPHRRLQRFRHFLLTDQSLSETRYYSYQQIKSAPPEYDAFVCGSDQIWNPTYEMDPTYFLKFTQDFSVKRIAYAASIGEESIPPDRRELLKQWISDIPFISIREKQGQCLIKELTRKEVPVVLDPTLLRSAEQWLKIAKPHDQNVPPYILVYGMVKDPLFLELVKHFKDRMGFRIVSIQSNPLIDNWVTDADEVVRDAGPREFVSLFANASFVCTNSFHGTAFSIIFKKPFAVARRQETFSRISGLLGILKITSQEVASSDAIASVPMDIDYSLVSPLLQKEITKSLSFLQSALS